MSNYVLLCFVSMIIGENVNNRCRRRCYRRH